MNPKKTLIVAIVCVVLIGGFLLDQRRKETAQERKVAESRLIAPKAETLTGIAIERDTPDASPLRIEKENHLWRIAEPFEAYADAATMQQVVNQIEQAKRESVFTPEGSDLSAYGLDKPVATVQFTSTATQSLPALKLGARTPQGNSVYARLGDQPEIFTLNDSIFRTLTSTPHQFRDKRLVPARVAEATTLTLAYDGNTFSVGRRGEDEWGLSEPVNQPADSIAVTDILSAWNSAQTIDFIDRTTKTLEQFGLDNPFVSASVFTEGDEGSKFYTMMVGDVVTTGMPVLMRYAKLEDKPTIFSVKDDLAKKLRADLGTLLNKDLFTIASADVGKVNFGLRRQETPVVRDAEGQWLLEDDPETSLDQTVVGTKVESLAGIKAVRFFDDNISTSITGLNSPNVMATLWSKDGTTSETLVTASKADDGDFVYSKFIDKAGNERIIGVDWRRPGDFFVTREDLLDKTLLEFEPDAVQKVTFHDDASSVTLARQSGGSWRGSALTGGQPAKEFDLEGATVNELLWAAKGLNWKRRLDPERSGDVVQIKTMELEEPPRRLAFFDADGAPVAELGIGNTNENNTYLRAGEQGYVIDEFRMQLLEVSLEKISQGAGIGTEAAPAGFQ